MVHISNNGFVRLTRGDSGSKLYAHYLYITWTGYQGFKGFARALIVSPLQDAATNGYGLVNLLNSVGASGADNKAVPVAGKSSNGTVLWY